MYEFSRMKTVLLSAVVLIIFVVSSAAYVMNTRDSLIAEAEANLRQVSTHGAALVSMQFEKDLKVIGGLSHIFETNTGLNEKEKIEILDKEAKKNDFKRICYVNLKGDAYSSDGFRFNIIDEEYFLQIFKNKTYISDTISDRLGAGGEIVVFSVPIEENGRVLGAIMAVRAVETLVSTTDIKFFYREGLTFIMDGSGTAILHTDEDKIGGNFLSVVKENNSDSKYYSLLNDMSRRINNSISLNILDTESYLGYSPIRMKPNWYFMTSVPTDVILAQANAIINQALRNSIIIMLLLVMIFSYILNARKKYEKELQKVAYTDELTKIWNLKKFLMETQSRINSKSNKKYGIGYFDINNFKSFNDMFGYDFGDKLLIEIANILKSLSKDVESYARAANDNFLIFYIDEGKEKTIERAKKFINAIENIVIDGRKIDIKMSMGFHSIPDDEKDIHLSLNKANMARGVTKRDRHIQYSFYSDEIRSILNDTAKLESDLRRAIKEKEFIVYQQPKFDLATRKIVGTEALIRWKPDGEHFISPAVFIPVAEKCGIILDIGRFVFEQVCQDISTYIKQGVEFLPVSINFSRVELYQTDLIDFVKTTLERYKIPPSLIEVELTETAALEDLEFIKHVISELKNIGLSVSLDDFGTGFSSLSCLKSIPIDTLKLDRSFLVDIETDERSRNIVKFIVFLVKSLELSVIAEGIETKEQTEFLEKIGCDLVQGFYFAHPMPVEEAIKLMKYKGGEPQIILGTEI